MLNLSDGHMGVCCTISLLLSVFTIFYNNKKNLTRRESTGKIY